jgi:hypothetical protein
MRGSVAVLIFLACMVYFRFSRACVRVLKRLLRVGKKYKVKARQREEK